MATGRHIQKKGPSNATPTPATGMFQPRPFAQTPKLKSTTTSELQTKVELGENSSRLSRMEISQPSNLQPKLAIGAPDDKYEQEADSIARQVVKHISSPTSPDANGADAAVQRQLFPTPSIMRLTVQRREATETGEASSDLESSISQAKGSGTPLGEPIRRQMEGAFGADFSGVKVHTDNTADTLNRSLSARAFTTGNNIFFKQGEYNPESSGGQELLAHELTHVVQQKSSPSIQCKLTPEQIKHANRIRKARGLKLLPVEDVEQFNTVDEAIDLDSAANPQAANPISDAIPQDSQSQVDQNDGSAETILKELKSWDKVKAEFSGDASTMQQFFDFRKQYVDGLISVLRHTYPGLIAKSVGSQDLTSDYDITISTPDSGNDVEAIKWFNAEVRNEFGVEPGTLFDTNLYAKDYLKVEENIDDSAKTEQNPDTDLAQPGGGFGGMGHLSQDVAALVKQRRYMKQVEWDRYVDSVVQSIDDPEQQALIRHQYEEADSVYQIFAHELLGEVEKELSASELEHIENHASLGKEEEEALKNEPDPAVREMLRKQLLNPDKLQAIAHDESDLVLKKSNELYLERMRKVRQIQATIRELGDGSPEKVEALKAQVKQLLGEACFFAAEAYHSEGAVKHIVAGVQGAKDPTKKAEIMNSLNPEHYLQSFNEQLGDFLKDLSHYAGQNSGKIFYRSSKYLYRLFLAVAELRQYKLPHLESLNIEQQHEAADKIAAKIDEKLVAIRKGKKPKENASETEKNEAAIAAMQGILNVNNPDELKTKILKMAQEFNSKVRSQSTELLAPDRNTSKTYFQNI
ncbi:DUF4157 domain-containing protein [Oscillatoria sp. HE19RPO]|uniref:eCIS core domain-containing protein n=1 Tax=Oscillatoria sp. HE19RPO TaxID=2954806 RepID=UPI0020C38E0D|nr:DUF4157 domain-containing protein [Oscillatoria sp. HE19RPO]